MRRLSAGRVTLFGILLLVLVAGCMGPALPAPWVLGTEPASQAALPLTDAQPPPSEPPATPPVPQPPVLLVDDGHAAFRFAVDRDRWQQWFAPAALTNGRTADSLVNRPLIKAFLQDLARQINRPMREGALDFDANAGALILRTPSQTGQELHLQASLAAIEAALAAGQPEVSLVLTVTHPRIDTSDLSALGIRELIAEGRTDFAGSSPQRVQNIAVGAAKFHNIVVAPDEEFSFNKVLGEINAAEGYAFAPIISGDRTELGLGGGICQVSTTVFRAAYLGGFPITERHPHSYVVRWYGEPGLDATIYSPRVDFRFRNDSGHYLLMQTAVDAQAGKLTVFLYGTRPDRRVESIGPIITNVRPAPAPRYLADASLPVGETRQIDWAVAGQDAVIIRRVHNADGTVREEQFTSHYQPWQAVFLFGPGADVPAATAAAAPAQP